jgi:hypothetical protein
MKIHLLRSPELKEETYRNVFNLLTQFRGSFQFIPSELESDFEDIEVDYRSPTFSKRFEAFKRNHPHRAEKKERTLFDEFRNEFETKKNYKTWEQLFGECETYRKKYGIPNDELVILLTNFGNEENWFGAVSPSMKNYFIQTSQWDYFFGSEMDIRFPIAYEVVSWVLRYLMFDTDKEIINNIHFQSIGCFMDFCEDKSEITIKMRTADVCESCMQRIIQRDIPSQKLQQIFDIIDGIRASMTFKSRVKIMNKPSRIEIRGFSHKIFLLDIGNLELPLNPKQRTLFLFFLNHPEGVELKCLSDYREEITALYRRFTKYSNPRQIQEAIDLLLDTTVDNNINETITRLNNSIRNTVSEHLAHYYCITGPRGGKKAIKLDREYVIYSY